MNDIVQCHVIVNSTYIYSCAYSNNKGQSGVINKVALEFMVYNNHATLVLGATPSHSRVITSNNYIVRSSCYNYNKNCTNQIA